VSLHPDDERMLDVAMEQPWGARLLSKIETHGPVAREGLTPCWIWTRGRDRDGYGAFSISGRSVRVNRLVCELVLSEPLGEQQALHICDAPACVRPSHLFVGSGRDNVADRVAKHRSARHIGERNPASKLTDDSVREIRQLLARGVIQREIAGRFNVDQVLISKIKHGRIWSHVTPANSNVAESA
jgi:hypothetical protein